MVRVAIVCRGKLACAFPFAEKRKSLRAEPRRATPSRAAEKQEKRTKSKRNTPPEGRLSLRRAFLVFVSALSFVYYV